MQSFFAWGAGRRLMLASFLAALLWGAVAWALRW
jgi:hypothetical protein